MKTGYSVDYYTRIANKVRSITLGEGSRAEDRADWDNRLAELLKLTRAKNLAEARKLVGDLPKVLNGYKILATAEEELAEKIKQLKDALDPIIINYDRVTVRASIRTPARCAYHDPTTVEGYFGENGTNWVNIKPIGHEAVEVYLTPFIKQRLHYGDLVRVD